MAKPTRKSSSRSSSSRASFESRSIQVLVVALERQDDRQARQGGDEQGNARRRPHRGSCRDRRQPGGAQEIRDAGLDAADTASQAASSMVSSATKLGSTHRRSGCRRGAAGDVRKMEFRRLGEHREAAADRHLHRARRGSSGGARKSTSKAAGVFDSREILDGRGRALKSTARKPAAKRSTTKSAASRRGQSRRAATAKRATSTRSRSTTSRGKRGGGRGRSGGGTTAAATAEPKPRDPRTAGAPVARRARRAR